MQIGDVRPVLPMFPLELAVIVIAVHPQGVKFAAVEDAANAGLAPSRAEAEIPIVANAATMKVCLFWRILVSLIVITPLC